MGSVEYEGGSRKASLLHISVMSAKKGDVACGWFAFILKNMICLVGITSGMRIMEVSLHLSKVFRFGGIWGWGLESRPFAYISHVSQEG